ncbi:MAG TPA: hypothetical protein VFR48_00665 [Solirubrobacteraceae bacterium]|nr:hypothetical protein [Solirubrobacteraceae bacterium]
MEGVKGLKVATIACVALAVAVGAWTLSRAPPRVLRANAPESAELATATKGAAACQANEALPAGTSAIRLGLDATFGFRVHVKVYSRSRLITEGSRAPDWTGGMVTIPVRPVDRTVYPAKLCFDVTSNSESIALIGFDTPTREAAVSRSGQALGGRLTVEYLANGDGSWWSRGLSVARHLGVGHVLAGTWVSLLVLGLMAIVGGLSLRAVWRGFE